MKAKLEALVESTGFQNFIMALIIVNAIILGLETSSTVQQAIGTWLGWIDGGRQCHYGRGWRNGAALYRKRRPKPRFIFLCLPA